MPKRQFIDPEKIRKPRTLNIDPIPVNAYDKSIEEEILYTSPDIDRQVARNICGAMLFEGDSALKKISQLFR